MKKNFNKILKSKRESKKLTQTELAKSINKSPQFICDIEAGRRTPGANTLIKLAKKLELSLDDIFLN